MFLLPINILSITIICMFNPPQKSTQSQTLAIVLCILGFFGVAGLHRIYTGKILTGLLWLVTGGLFAIGTLVDLISLAYGTFDDKRGRPLS